MLDISPDGSQRRSSYLSETKLRDESCKRRQIAVDLSLPTTWVVQHPKKGDAITPGLNRTAITAKRRLEDALRQTHLQTKTVGTANKREAADRVPRSGVDSASGRFRVERRGRQYSHGAEADMSLKGLSLYRTQ